MGISFSFLLKHAWMNLIRNLRVPLANQGGLNDLDSDDGRIGLADEDRSVALGRSSRRHSSESVSKRNVAEEYWALFYTRPREEFIHKRFCCSYQVHDWVHLSFVRALLFSLLCSSKRFPSSSDIRLCISLTSALANTWNADILNFLEPYIISAAAPLLWDNPLRMPHVLEVREWNKDERGLGSIFFEMYQWRNTLNKASDYPDAPSYIADFFFSLHDFYTKPAEFFPRASDILSLPPVRALLKESAHQQVGPLAVPPLDETRCVCGECSAIHSRNFVDLQRFRYLYFDMVREASSRGCVAMRDAWEPVLQLAESWLEDLMGRIETSSCLFPSTCEYRSGPLVVEATVEEMGVGLCSDLTTSQLLQLAVALKLFCTAGDRRNEVVWTGMDLPSEGVGYIAALHPGDTPASLQNHLLVVRAGWMFELSSSHFSDEHGDITILQQSDDLSFWVRSPNIGIHKAFNILMPEGKLDRPYIAPAPHDPNAHMSFTSHGMTTSFPGTVVHTCLVLSNDASDGFPELSTSRAWMDLAVLIRVTVGQTVFETAWRPQIERGSKCEHRLRNQETTHCSYSANDIISEVQPPNDDRATTERLPDSDRRLLAQFRELSASLRARGAPFAPGAICIVRCGTVDGPPEPIVALAASLGKRIYVIHRQECWDCALFRLRERSCTVAIALETKNVTVCDHCRRR